MSEAMQLAEPIPFRSGQREPEPMVGDELSIEPMPGDKFSVDSHGRRVSVGACNCRTNVDGLTNWPHGKGCGAHLVIDGSPGSHGLVYSRGMGWFYSGRIIKRVSASAPPAPAPVAAHPGTLCVCSGPAKPVFIGAMTGWVDVCATCHREKPPAPPAMAMPPPPGSDLLASMQKAMRAWQTQASAAMWMPWPFPTPKAKP